MASISLLSHVTRLASAFFVLKKNICGEIAVSVDRYVHNDFRDEVGSGPTADEIEYTDVREYISRTRTYYTLEPEAACYSIIYLLFRRRI